MAVSPNVSLQFQRVLGRASEPKKARATGTVTAVSADSDNKIKNATISTGGGLISLPVPYGINVYTGMNVAITNDGTPSNAQWRLAGTTSLPGGIQGGSIINHDGNTFAMFDSIWVRNDGVIIVGGDIDIDGNPSGPRVESNQCGYFGFDQYDRQSLAIYAAACDDHFAGDVLLGPEEAARIEILPNDGTVSVTYDSETILEFGPDGNFIRKPVTVGNPVGARINLGEIEDKATFVLRDKHGVAKMVARTDDDSDVYVHIGNPPPEDNSMWFDSADGCLNVNGHVTMQSMDVRGRATFASTGEFMIIDPDDPGRFGVITPKGQYAYTTDALGVVHLIRMDAWGPLTLESEYGSGIWRTWVGGTQIFGDVRYRHFRIERGATARAGFFNGESPIIYLDATGKGYFSGEIEVVGNVTTTAGAVIWADGKGRADNLGISVQGYALPSGTNETRNRYRIVDNTGDELAWIGGYYSATANSMIQQVNSVGKSKNATLALQSCTSTGYRSETNIVAIQGETTAFFAAIISDAGVSSARISATELSFHGVTPVARQLLATGAGATVDNVITALQNLGLVRQS